MSLQRKDITEAITKARTASKKRKFAQTFELAINFFVNDTGSTEKTTNVIHRNP